ncbi:MAG TPA: NADH-quinone oxidoreductase subunit I [Anaeromyxobacteraceae bacterium]|jgi:NADH-quinone oxidoreductase subunit I/NAD(P)H-quinone oxidoreductase subunit I|nr:NADH-quinone oxidoreductase subunit I [Anaeromyxobacteraceae bacterium]
MNQSAATYFGNIKGTVQSFWHGMSVTLSYLLRRPTTIQYPDRTPLPVRDMLPPRYRGFLEVDADICTGCQACERACPIACIQINLEKDPANPKQRVVSQFDIDEAKCMFCGLCVEPCPTGAIQHTREFEASQRFVRNLVFRWADPLKPFPVYKVAKGADYFPRVPLGSLVRARLEVQTWDAPAPEYLPPEAPKPPAAKAPAAPATPAAKPAAAAAAAAAPAAKPAASVAVSELDPAAVLKAAAASVAPASPAPAPDEVAVAPVAAAAKPTPEVKP